VRLGIGIDFVEWEVINRVALLVDAVDGFLTELISETKRDLGAFVRIFVEFFRRESIELVANEISPIGQRFHCNLGWIEFGETRGDVAQFRLFGRRKHTVDFHIMQILTRVVEMVRAKHHYLDRDGRRDRTLREEISAKESSEAGVG
jgi:hypothetical protein